MIRINLLRKQPEPLKDGEKIYLSKMMMNAYNLGLQAGEARAYGKVCDLLKVKEIQFSSLLNRSRIGDHVPDPFDSVLHGSIHTKKG